MDRPLSPSELRSTRRRKASIGIVALLTATAGYCALGRWIRPTVDRHALRLEKVEEGSIDSTLQAAGTVVPLEERLVTSPADARLLRVLHRAGDHVQAGEPILLLDSSGLELDRSKLAQQLALRGNERRRAKLASEHRVSDLEADLRGQRLALGFLSAKREQTEKLHADGLASREALLSARLEVEQAQAVLEKIEASVANARESVAAELDGIELQIGILERELAVIDRSLAQAKASSETAGTLTWALTEPGTQVRAGDILARLSDLSAFRVRATVSDMHASRVEAGMKARVHVDGASVDGTIGTVLPAVENGTVSFLVDLDEPSHPGLRASRKVDVEVVVEHRERTKIVRRGPGITGTGPQRLFVVRGDRAERREVTVGLMNLDWCELTSGVSPGDQLILSETRVWDAIDVLTLR